jgi:hypothetical protein
MLCMCVCACAPLFQLLNQLTSSYEICCERYDITGNLSVVLVNFLQLLIGTWRTHELEVGAVTSVVSSKVLK